MKLWYRNGAEEWTQALPIGNGHMGAMCYGGAGGRYDLSENTCWSGHKQPDPLKEHAKESMKAARELLLKGEYARGEALLENCTGNKVNYGTQVPMGRLKAAVEKAPDSVYRELDLETGVALDRLQYGESQVCRESFLSNPDKVMGVRMTAAGQMPDLCLWLEGWSQPSNTGWMGEEKLLLVRGREIGRAHV